MKKLLFILITIIIAGVAGYKIPTTKVQAQTPTENKKGFAQCVGDALAEYFQTIIKGTKGMSNLRMLTPAFNLTNPVEFDMFMQMKITSGEYFKPLNYPNFYGFIGNAYTLDGVRAYDWWTKNYNWKGETVGAYAGTKMIFSEFGDFDTFGNGRGLGHTDRSQIIGDMVQDFKTTSGDSLVAGINYFAALHADHGYYNPEFVGHNLTDDEFRLITSSNPTLAGENPGLLIGGSTLPTVVKAAGLNVGWVLEIITGPGDIDRATDFVKAAHERGMNPILRTCLADSCGFANPDDYLPFLQQLNQNINGIGPVWIIAGPNEPATEHWAAPDCQVEKKPFELNEIDCRNTTEPEFHSLRPYPTSPCNKSEPQVFICGQDLVVKEKYEFAPGDATSCEQITLDDGTRARRCFFQTVNSSSKVSLGLKNARFPIMGNTELVPNSTQSTSKLNFSQRLNEYVSWYLNGVTYRAEELPVDDMFTKIGEFVTYSGPLKKLLPYKVQTQERLKQFEDLIGENPIRHNQIVACGPNDDPATCYKDSTDYKRITDVVNGGNYTQNSTYKYVPMSSTEDRLGRGESYLKASYPPCPVTSDPTKDFGVRCVDYKSDTQNQNLYFPHIDESNELGYLLQGTFKTKSVDDTNSAPIQPLELLINTPYCELQESRTNPGDKLYGELERPNSDPAEQISGTLSYSANFECVFADPTQEQIDQCMLNCEGKTGEELLQCQSDCNVNKSTCQREIYIPVGINIKAPDLDITWTRFVAGSQSIFKRMFPKIGKNTPVEEIKDIPGSTKAVYESNNAGTPHLISNEPLAGNPAQQRPGSTAEVYFPHIGSVYDYFLKGIQKALRPQGLNELPADDRTDTEPIPGDFPGIACPTSVPAIPLPGSGIMCSVNCSTPDSSVPAKYLALKNNYIRMADQWIAGENPSNNHARECFNDVVVRSLNAGVNPVYSLAIWLQESDASNYSSRITKCDPNDPSHTIQDFGINNPSYAGNFNAQLNQFLRLVYLYPVNYKQCFPNQSCSVEGFSRVFQQGASATCEMTQGGINYAAKTKRTMEAVAGGCGNKILYPTDMSCP